MPETICVGMTATTSSTFSVGVTMFSDAPTHGRIAAVPREQLYYWSRQWQEDERLALSDLDNGRAIDFANGTDAVRWLLSAED